MQFERSGFAQAMRQTLWCIHLYWFKVSELERERAHRGGIGNEIFVGLFEFEIRI